MKQMFSVFCALMIVLSTSAAPAKALRPLKNQLESKTAARKRIENNQLIIERQGVRYNALGTVVK